jgi:hypothetical protein
MTQICSFGVTLLYPFTLLIYKFLFYVATVSVDSWKYTKLYHHYYYIVSISIIFFTFLIH